MNLRRRLATTYVRIWRTYRAWAPSLLLLGLVVFIPLGLLDSLAVRVDVEALDLSSGIKVTAFLLAVLAVSTTGLLGEVFFSGAVAVSLTHPDDERPPSLTYIARRLNYGRLIAVDVLYVIAVAAGLAVFVVPGVLAFIWLGLAGPIVELEECGVRRAFARSVRLIRGNFWFVFWILVPIELAGDALGGAIAAGTHALLGHGFLASWFAESASNIVLSPFFAVAAVLLTLDLIRARDGAAPRLNSRPVPA
ncbi:MAG: hypothetical protein U0R71_15140 [Solirubrobacterales bacterium]